MRKSRNFTLNIIFRENNGQNDFVLCADYSELCEKMMRLRVNLILRNLLFFTLLQIIFEKLMCWLFSSMHEPSSWFHRIIVSWIMRHLNFLTIPATPPSESDGEYNQIIMNFWRFSAKVRRPDSIQRFHSWQTSALTTGLTIQHVKMSRNYQI